MCVEMRRESLEFGKAISSGKSRGNVETFFQARGVSERYRNIRFVNSVKTRPIRIRRIKIRGSLKRTTVSRLRTFVREYCF